MPSTLYNTADRVDYIKDVDIKCFTGDAQLLYPFLPKDAYLRNKQINYDYVYLHNYYGLNNLKLNIYKCSGLLLAYLTTLN